MHSTLCSDLFGISDNALHTIAEVSGANAACVLWWDKFFTTLIRRNLFTSREIFFLFNIGASTNLLAYISSIFPQIFPQNNVRQWWLSDLALKPFLLFSAQIITNHTQINHSLCKLHHICTPTSPLECTLLRTCSSFLWNRQFFLFWDTLLGSPCP